jgi:putative addiction module component (TIGR02574 family)
MSDIVIHDLSPADRLALISELWDSLEPGEVPITPAQREELDRRLSTADADARRGKTWSVLQADLRRRLR